MKEKPAGGRPIEEILDLLKNQDFCADAQRVLMEAAEITTQAPNAEERQVRLERLGQPFFERWGVPPPMSTELFDSDPRRRLSDAIASGRWGLLLICSYTTNQLIRRSLTTIRSVVRKRHQDALIDRHAHLVRWLDASGFDRPAIARAVFGRRSGLRRPTKVRAIARTPEHRERQLLEEYRALGFTPKQVEQKTYKRLRGSEALASAAVRMTAKRYVDRITCLNVDLAKPIQAEPLSHALTMLHRALLDGDNTAIRRDANAVREAFVSTFRPARSTTQRRDAARQAQPLDAIGSAFWGVIPVFPWTTDPEIRASVKKLRTLMPEHFRDRDGSATGSRPSRFEPLSDALISLLQALTYQDTVLVRRHSSRAWAAFLQASAS